MKGLFGGLVQVALYAAALLLPAGWLSGGTWHWTRALAFLAVYAAALEGFVFLLAVWAPASLQARVRPPVSAAQPRADRYATAFLRLATLAWCIFVPVDVFSMKFLPAPSFTVSAVGAGVGIGGLVAIMAAIAQNAFAIPIVEDQTPRAQILVDRGLYAHVRHPMYTGVLLFHAGLALWLRSYAGVLALAVILVPLAARIVVEEGTLAQTLEGYTGYARRVPYRLVPFVW
jgi:protein-S-isoprenylcysteine O-methyltransferase Ste14